MSRQDSQSPTGYSEDGDSARSQRIAAMRELTGADTSAASSPISPTIRPPVRRNRRVPALLIALTAVVLLAVVGAAWQGWFPWQRGMPTTTDTTVSVNLADNNLHCPSAAVWSPDNKHIAVLAQLGACTNRNAGTIEPNVVALFDTQGNLERQLYPDSITLGNNAPITPQPTPREGAPLPTTIPSFVQYFAMGWSPNGNQLALVYQTTFEYDESAPVDKTSFESGVALLPADGGDGEKLSGFHQSPYDVWDLQAHKQIHADNAAQVFALAYRWSSQGTLDPVADSLASGPIGNPSGGQQFTIWQPGSVFLDREKQSLFFNSSVMAWSPEGRYMSAPLGFGGILTSNVSGFVRQDDGSYQLEFRDKALVIAASQLKAPSDPYAAFMPVAWRGNGRLLAAREPNALLDQMVQNVDGRTIPSATERIVVYDCATGVKRLTLSAKLIASRLQYSDTMPLPLLRWSSSGQKLMFLDASFDSLTIWDVALK